MKAPKNVWVVAAVLVVLLGLLTVYVWWLVYTELKSPPPVPIPIQLSELKKAAKERDPFACGQGLKYIVKHPRKAELGSTMYTDFYKWCCNPPVDDMAGLVAPICATLRGEQ